MFKTGRSSRWFFAILFLPYVGGIAYFIIEILPDLRLNRSLPQFTDIVASKIIPSRKIDKLKLDAQFTPSFNNRKNLADEYLASGYFDEAINLYDELLQGHESQNVICLLQKAKALYGKNNFEEAGKIINQLEELKFPFNREDEILVKLKIYEHLLKQTQVDELYENAKQKFNSFEINYYYIDYQIRRGENEKARKIIDEIKETKIYLQKKHITFDRVWANKSIALGRKILP
jgi:hypothetical protein